MFEKLDHWPEFEALYHDLKSHWKDLAEEAQSLMGGSAYTPWHERDIYSGEWNTHGVFWAGKELEQGASSPLCKEILSAWQPLVFNAGFSVLKPGTEIKPHMGYTGDVLRLHVGLCVPDTNPEACGIQVGDEKKGWVEGEILLFDDTQVHAAWNRSNYVRIVLILDLLRPRGREKWREDLKRELPHSKKSAE